MTTKRKDKGSDAMAFLNGLVGPLTIGAMLESHRLCEEMSQAELARTLGISRSHLNDIEKGRKTVSPARATGFAKALGLSEVSWVKVALEEELCAAGLEYDVTVSVKRKSRKKLPDKRATVG